jgi:thiamine pyrophosphate-dependent acetolactate synthase large subunit-like protein
MVTDKRRENMDRRQAVNKLLAARDGALVITGLGSPSYDVHAHGDAANNYYLWGAMGGAALTGLGLAQAQPEKRVMVITGDGEQLMAFGSLATIAVAKPANLGIIILDNQHFGETGMQPSHTASGIDFSVVAAACGFAEAQLLTSLGEVDTLCDNLKKIRWAPIICFESESRQSGQIPAASRCTIYQKPLSRPLGASPMLGRSMK